MNERFLKAFQFEEQLCLSESMIPYYPKNLAKWYIKKDQ